MSSKRLYLDTVFSRTNKRELRNDEDDPDDIITALESDEEYEREDIETVDETILNRIFGSKQAETKTILEKCRNQVLDEIMSVKRMKVTETEQADYEEDNGDDCDNDGSDDDDFETMMLKERDNQVQSKNCIYETKIPEEKDLDLFYSNSIEDRDSGSTCDNEEAQLNNRSITWDNIHENLGIKATSQSQSDATFQNNIQYGSTLRRGVNEIITETSNKSDAILDCPSCMTRVTNNCQRHETFKNHYRAMFVDNCHVDFTQEIIVKPTKSSRRQMHQIRRQVAPVDKNLEAISTEQMDCEYMTEDSNSKHSSLPSINSDDKSIFFRVRCAKCSTLVGMLDRDEVYHFYNVLASHR